MTETTEDTETTEPEARDGRRGFPPELAELRADGSAVIHLGAAGDYTIPPLTIGQFRAVWILDDEHRPPAPDNTDREAIFNNARWLRGVLEAAGLTPPDLDAMPTWTLGYDLRNALVAHWLSVPFRSGDGTPQTPTTSPRRSRGRSS